MLVLVVRVRDATMRRIDPMIAVADAAMRVTTATVAAVVAALVAVALAARAHRVRRVPLLRVVLGDVVLCRAAPMVVHSETMDRDGVVDVC